MDILNLQNIYAIEDINLSSEEEEEDIRLRAPKRYISDGQNPFEFYNEWEFKRRFRFKKESVMHCILPLIEEGLIKVNNRGLPIAPVIQLLVCLRFYATSSFQLVVGDVIQISQSTVSRILCAVSTLLASYINRYIKMSVSHVMRSENKRKFEELGRGPGGIGLPSIDGAIDCTHIRLTHTRFHNIDEIFRNQKGYFSLNVQVCVCECQKCKHRE